MLHALTEGQDTELYVKLRDWNCEKKYAWYTRFWVGSEATRYTLTVDGYNGTAGTAEGFL